MAGGEPDAYAEAPGDFWAQKVRARGAFREEYAPQSELWLPEARVEQLRQWVGRAFPGPLQTLRHGRRDEVSFTAGALVASVERTRERLVVTVHGFEAGFLHAVAQGAAEAGVAALVVDGESFYGPAPYLALTEHLPGVEPRTEWFDPLRGLLPGVAARAWLARYAGCDEPLERWAHTRDDDRPREILGRFAVMSGGRLLPAVHWQEEAAGPARPPAPNVVDVGPEMSLWRLPANRAEAIASGVSALVALGAMSGLSLAVAVLGASLSAPRTLGDALLVGGVCTALTGWLGVVPSRWPSGRAVPRALRAGWFGCGPMLVVLARYALGGTA